MNKQRLEAEKTVYKVMDILDPSGENTDFWKEKFSKMSDDAFKKYISNDFPFYFQTKAFQKYDMDMIYKALDSIGVPLLEEIYVPFDYKDENGRPMKSHECLVVYLPIKRMKQLLTKKNGMSIYSNTRDISGLLSSVDKNAKESDREFESLAIFGFENTMKELSKPRADSMADKSVMNSTISTLGQVSLSELPDDPTDSLSKNLLSTYFIGAQLYTNIVNEEYYLPHTLKLKADKKLDRR